jgi:hypothetical protein
MPEYYPLSRDLTRQASNKEDKKKFKPFPNELRLVCVRTFGVEKDLLPNNRGTWVAELRTRKSLDHRGTWVSQPLDHQLQSTGLAS